MKQQNLDQAYDLTTGRGRLERLVEVLDWVEREKLPFDIGSWFQKEDCVEDCGTAACAAGWACRDPLLALQGLSIQNAMPLFAGLSNFLGLAAFFTIPVDKSWYFFWGAEYYVELPDRRPTPADVAARIRAHLAETA